MFLVDQTDQKLKLSRPQLAVTCLVLSLVVLAWTLDSFLKPMIASTDLNIMATIVAKDRDANLFSRDHLFAGDELYQLYTPLYRWIIAQAWQMGGSFERGLAWLVPPVLGAYLAGMFIVFWRISRNGWVALGLAVAAAHFHPITMGAGVWGVGGSTEMMSRALFMPVIPWLTLMYWDLFKKPGWVKGALLGLLLGLATNLHPVSGFHFLAIFSLGWLLVHGATYRGWQTLLATGVAAAAGAWPVAANYLGNSGQPVSQAISFETFSQMVMQRYAMPFFPGVFDWPLFNLQLTRPVLDGLVWFYVGLAGLFLLAYGWGWRRWPGLRRWSWLIGGLITAAYAYMLALFETTPLFVFVALYVVYRFWQGLPTRLEGWLVTLTGLVVFYAFAGYYFLTYLWQTFELWPLTSLLIEYARSARLLYLPIYLLAALAGAAWFEALKARLPFGQQLRPAWAAAGLAGLFIVMLFGPLAPLSAGVLPLPARNLLDPASLVTQPTSNPVDAELYSWVRQHTGRDSLFFACFGPETLTYFRRNAERSLTHNWKDLTFIIHNRATLIPNFERYRKFEAACQDFKQLVAAAHSAQADYVLVSSQSAAGLVSEACFVNDKYALFALNAPDCATDQLLSGQ